MSYTPKHAAAPSPRTTRRAVGVAVASAATLGAGLAGASAAHAETPWNVWDAVATCESGNNWHLSTGNGYYGGLQFSQSTWAGYGGGQYGSYAHQASRDQQIIVAQRVLRAAGPGSWPACSVRAGLTRQNGLAVVVGGGTSRDETRELSVDGAFGPMTVRATQKWIGVAQDGVWGTGSRKALQRKLGVTADGVVGRQTIAALQSRIGIARDGASYLDSRTVVGLQRYLNAHVL